MKPQLRTVQIAFEGFTLTGYDQGAYNVRVDDLGVWIRAKRKRGPWRFLQWEDVLLSCLPTDRLPAGARLEKRAKRATVAPVDGGPERERRPEKNIDALQLALDDLAKAVS